MKAILIDPSRCSVEAIDHSGKYEDTLSTLGCSMIEAVRLDGIKGDGSDFAYIDEEGMLVPAESQQYFALTVNEMTTIIAGPAIIFSSDDEGNNMATTLFVNDVIGSVFFIEQPTQDQIDRYLINTTRITFGDLGV